jgi:hypothetical protein
LTVPTSLLLVGLFFMPWVNVSCHAPSELAIDVDQSMAELTEMPPVEGLVGHATGYDLARGRITPADGGSKSLSVSIGSREVPAPRFWMYAALVVPGFLAVLGVLTLLGPLPPHNGGRSITLLALIGAAVVFSGTQIDYVSEYASNAEDQGMLTGGTSKRLRPWQRQREINRIKQELRKGVVQQTTWYPWVSLGLYGLVGLCGVVITDRKPMCRALPLWKAGAAGADGLLADGLQRAAAAGRAQRDGPTDDGVAIDFGEELPAVPDSARPKSVHAHDDRGRPSHMGPRHHRLVHIDRADDAAPDPIAGSDDADDA